MLFAWVLRCRGPDCCARIPRGHCEFMRPVVLVWVRVRVQVRRVVFFGIVGPSNAASRLHLVCIRRTWKAGTGGWCRGSRIVVVGIEITGLHAAHHVCMFISWRRTHAAIAFCFRAWWAAVALSTVMRTANYRRLLHVGIMGF